MRTIKIAIFLIVLFLLNSCREDTFNPTLFGSMVGTVLQDIDNVAVSNVVISTTPPTSLILTDSFGRFSLEDIEPGTYTIRAEKEGFATQVESVTVFAEKTANVIIKLGPDDNANTAPTAPSMPLPTDGSLQQETELVLTWTASDADRNDVLRYDVLLCAGTQSNCEMVAVDLEEPTYTLSNLQYATNYFWQVVVKDKAAAVYSNIWTFQTKDFPNFRFVYAKKENEKYDIYAADETGNEIRLTQGGGSNYRPRISPNRQKIAYISNVGVEPHLFIMNRDGSEPQQVTKEVPIAGYNNFDLDFSWSPTSDQLLYMNNAMLYVINSNGTGLREMAKAPEGFTFSEVDWTESGNRIVARVTGSNIYESNIFILDENGNYIKQVFTDLPGRTGGLQFSIDGNFVLYTHDVASFENAAGRQLNSHVFIKNLQNNVTQDLSGIDQKGKPAGTLDLDPRFSPDGSKVIFVNTNNDGISPRNIMIMDRNGQNRTLLFEGAEMPDWR
jgi:TolB protein